MLLFFFGKLLSWRSNTIAILISFLQFYWYTIWFDKAVGYQFLGLALRIGVRHAPIRLFVLNVEQANPCLLGWVCYTH